MIKIVSLSFSYNSTQPPILKDISFEIEKGRCLAILGNNGAGKSTLLKCINRIYKINSGSMVAEGIDLLKISRKEMAKRIAYVPQHSPTGNIMVFDAVLLGRKPYIRWDAGEEDHQIVQNILHRLELEKYSARNINELSGGELQKVVLARALAQEPQYLLLDEPTSSLDPKNQHEILKLVLEVVRERDIGVAIVIHDLNLAVRYCDRFLFIRNSGVYSYGGPSSVTAQTIFDVYNMKTDIIKYNGQTLIVPK